MADELSTRPEGRPTLKTEDTIKKLEDILRLGASDRAAYSYAGISGVTFYDWIKKDEAFSNRMESARQYAIIAARQNIVRSIVEDKDLDTSKWYIEKHDTKQVVNQQNTQVNVFAALKDKYTIKKEEGQPDVINVEPEEKHDGA